MSDGGASPPAPEPPTQVNTEQEDEDSLLGPISQDDESDVEGDLSPSEEQDGPVISADTAEMEVHMKALEVHSPSPEGAPQTIHPDSADGPAPLIDSGCHTLDETTQSQSEELCVFQIITSPVPTPEIIETADKVVSKVLSDLDSPEEQMEVQESPSQTATTSLDTIPKTIEAKDPFKTANLGLQEAGVNIDSFARQCHHTIVLGEDLSCCRCLAVPSAGYCVHSTVGLCIACMRRHMEWLERQSGQKAPLMVHSKLMGRNLQVIQSNVEKFEGECIPVYMKSHKSAMRSPRTFDYHTQQDHDHLSAVDDVDFTHVTLRTTSPVIMEPFCALKPDSGDDEESPQHGHLSDSASVEDADMDTTHHSDVDVDPPSDPDTTAEKKLSVVQTQVELEKLAILISEGTTNSTEERANQYSVLMTGKIATEKGTPYKSRDALSFIQPYGAEMYDAATPIRPDQKGRNKNRRKKLVTPATENMYEYRVDGETMEETEECKDMIAKLSACYREHEDFAKGKGEKPLQFFHTQYDFQTAVGNAIRLGQNNLIIALCKLGAIDLHVKLRNKLASWLPSPIINTPAYPHEMLYESEIVEARPPGHLDTTVPEALLDRAEYRCKEEDCARVKKAQDKNETKVYPKNMRADYEISPTSSTLRCPACPPSAFSDQKMMREMVKHFAHTHHNHRVNITCPGAGLQSWKLPIGHKNVGSKLPEYHDHTDACSKPFYSLCKWEKHLLVDHGVVRMYDRTHFIRQSAGKWVSTQFPGYVAPAPGKKFPIGTTWQGGGRPLMEHTIEVFTHLHTQVRYNVADLCHLYHLNRPLFLAMKNFAITLEGLDNQDLFTRIRANQPRQVKKRKKVVDESNRPNQKAPRHDSASRRDSVAHRDPPRQRHQSPSPSRHNGSQDRGRPGSQSREGIDSNSHSASSQRQLVYSRERVNVKRGLTKGQYGKYAQYQGPYYHGRGASTSADWGIAGRGGPARDANPERDFGDQGRMQFLREQSATSNAELVFLENRTRSRSRSTSGSRGKDPYLGPKPNSLAWSKLTPAKRQFYVKKNASIHLQTDEDWTADADQRCFQNDSVEQLDNRGGKLASTSFTGSHQAGHFARSGDPSKLYTQEVVPPVDFVDPREEDKISNPSYVVQSGMSDIQRNRSGASHSDSSYAAATQQSASVLDPGDFSGPTPSELAKALQEAKDHKNMPPPIITPLEPVTSTPTALGPPGSGSKSVRKQLNPQRTPSRDRQRNRSKDGSRDRLRSSKEPIPEHLRTVEGGAGSPRRSPRIDAQQKKSEVKTPESHKKRPAEEQMDMDLDVVQGHEDSANTDTSPARKRLCKHPNHSFKTEEEATKLGFPGYCAVQITQHPADVPPLPAFVHPPVNETPEPPYIVQANNGRFVGLVSPNDEQTANRWDSRAVHTEERPPCDYIPLRERVMYNGLHLIDPEASAPIVVTPRAILEAGSLARDARRVVEAMQSSFSCSEVARVRVAYLNIREANAALRTGNAALEKRVQKAEESKATALKQRTAQMKEQEGRNEVNMNRLFQELEAARAQITYLEKTAPAATDVTPGGSIILNGTQPLLLDEVGTWGTDTVDSVIRKIADRSSIIPDMLKQVEGLEEELAISESANKNMTLRVNEAERANPAHSEIVQQQILLKEATLLCEEYGKKLSTATNQCAELQQGVTEATNRCVLLQTSLLDSRDNCNRLDGQYTSLLATSKDAEGRAADRLSNVTIDLALAGRDVKELKANLEICKSQLAAQGTQPAEGSVPPR